MSSILCIGLNPAIDVVSSARTVQPTHKVRTKDQKYYPGGGAINVARVICELGGTPSLAFLSGGITGPVFDALLDKYEIKKHRFEMRGAVRIAYMIKVENTGSEFRFVPEGPIVHVYEIEPLMNFVGSFDAQYLVASGSLPRGLPTNSYARIAKIAKEKNMRFILDTSGEALREAFSFGGIFLAKPSKHEMELFVGHELDDQSLQEVVSALVTKGTVEHLVVSLGAEGALLANTDGITKLPSIKVQVRSAVGAGDSFVGALVWYLSKGKPIAEAFRFGVAAGSAAVMTPGTELCHRADIESLFYQLNSQ